MNQMSKEEREERDRRSLAMMEKMAKKAEEQAKRFKEVEADRLAAERAGASMTLQPSSVSSPQRRDSSEPCTPSDAALRKIRMRETRNREEQETVGAASGAVNTEQSVNWSPPQGLADTASQKGSVAVSPPPRRLPQGGDAASPRELASTDLRHHLQKNVSASPGQGAEKPRPAGRGRGRGRGVRVPQGTALTTPGPSVVSGPIPPSTSNQVPPGPSSSSSRGEPSSSTHGGLSLPNDGVSEGISPPIRLDVNVSPQTAVTPHARNIGGSAGRQGREQEGNLRGQSGRQEKDGERYAGGYRGDPRGPYSGGGGGGKGSDHRSEVTRDRPPRDQRSRHMESYEATRKKNVQEFEEELQRQGDDRHRNFLAEDDRLFRQSDTRLTNQEVASRAAEAAGSQQQQQSNRAPHGAAYHQQQTRHPRNYGGETAESLKRSVQSAGMVDRGRGRGRRGQADLTLSMTGQERASYTDWKDERVAIDREREERAKTSGGSWKREWDKEKKDGGGGQIVDSDSGKRVPFSRPGTKPSEVAHPGDRPKGVLTHTCTGPQSGGRGRGRNRKEPRSQPATARGRDTHQQGGGDRGDRPVYRRPRGGISESSVDEQQIIVTKDEEEEEEHYEATTVGESEYTVEADGEVSETAQSHGLMSSERAHQSVNSQTAVPPIDDGHARDSHHVCPVAGDDGNFEVTVRTQSVEKEGEWEAGDGEDEWEDCEDAEMTDDEDDVGEVVDSISSRASTSKEVTPVPQTASKEVTPDPQTASKEVTPVPQTASKEVTQVPQTASKEVTPAPQTPSKEVTPVPQTASKEVTQVSQTASKDVTQVSQTASKELSSTANLAVEAGGASASDTVPEEEACPATSSKSEPVVQLSMKSSSQEMTPLTEVSNGSITSVTCQGQRSQEVNQLSNEGGALHPRNDTKQETAGVGRAGDRNLKLLIDARSTAGGSNSDALLALRPADNDSEPEPTPTPEFLKVDLFKGTWADEVDKEMGEA